MRSGGPFVVSLRRIPLVVMLAEGTGPRLAGQVSDGAGRQRFRARVRGW